MTPSHSSGKELQPPCRKKLRPGRTERRRWYWKTVSGQSSEGSRPLNRGALSPRRGQSVQACEEATEARKRPPIGTEAVSSTCSYQQEGSPNPQAAGRALAGQGKVELGKCSLVPTNKA